MTRPNFDKIRIGLASPDVIKKWSYGEVKKPETINYRTLKPEKEGLFCEKIFGPVKDWECHCGKYKRIRYKNIRCEACGVEVIQSKVRRERMGHIQLATPVSHIWYFKGTPSRMSYLLGISVKELERVLYYSDYMVTKVDEAGLEGLLKRKDQDKVDVKKLMPTFFENAARLEWFEEEGTKYPAVTNVKVIDLGMSREAREDIQNAMKRLQGIFLEDGEVEAAVEGPERGVKKVAVRKKMGAEVRHLGYLPQAIGKCLIPHLEEGRKFSAVVDRISKGAGDRKKLSLWLRIAFEDKSVTQSVFRTLQTKFKECEAVYHAIYLDEGVSLLKNLKPKQTLETGIEGTVYKFGDGRVFKEEDQILYEVFELDFYVPRKYELIMKLANSLAACLNDYSVKDAFRVSMGAQAVKEALASERLDDLAASLREEIKTSKKQKRMKLIKRLSVVESFRKSRNKPEWMVLDLIPVLPPDVRPMVQLEGGRFASSDLNDLYRRVINRNNRLKKLIEIKAPESIIRNEKRMLQEAVDALIDNGRRGRVFTGSHKRPLKSLSELLKGKQGRFRQNLLGKRVDYSGRSVIVIGPELKLHQCGLPKEMALELFKPFVMHELVKRGVSANIKAAKKVVERMEAPVWDVLGDVTRNHPVLLNRAPTLHRLGIQAFQPKLVEGKAIQIHPLVCAAFNADFDGDQMAVHVPLSMEAQAEARLIMLATNNLLYPADGRPIVAPSQDIVLGVYYLSLERPGETGEGKIFSGFEEVMRAYELGFVHLHARIRCRFRGKVRETTVGRLILNNAFPENFDYINCIVDKKELSNQIGKCLRKFGRAATVRTLDSVKDVGFQYATRAGITISIDDIAVPVSKKDHVKDAERKEKEVDDFWGRGLYTDDERYRRRIKIWQDCNDRVRADLEAEFEKDLFNNLFMMAKSGARGKVQQITQLAGLRGLMNDPTGKIIDFPIKANFREGLTVLEYFISTHGARKGLADTALRTADSGYLTRRLVDVAQDVIVQEDDCGSRRSLDVDSVYFNGRDKSIVSELDVKKLKMAGKKPPLDIREPLMYGMDLKKRSYPTVSAKNKRTRVFLRKIYAARNELGEPTALEQESRGAYYDGLVIDGPSLPGSARQLFGERILGRTAAADIFSIETGEVFVRKGDLVLEDDLDRIVRSRVAGPVKVRTVLECQTRHGCCAKCYGRNFATGKMAQVSDAVGIIAAQSIGEPGTQLTMRTFHTGGVSSEQDITQGLPRVEELFEARIPKRCALMTETEGTVEIVSGDVGREIVITPKGARSAAKKTRIKLPNDATPAVRNGDYVEIGSRLTDGHMDPHEILRVLGLAKAQSYLVNEVIAVYKSQGVDTNEKHVEVIVREILRKVKVETGGDTDFLPHSMVDRFEFDRVNREMRANGLKPAVGKPVLLGITKCSLSTNSFLSAASFQETTRVLTDAAVRGKVDNLVGLKENVIIGNLIPAGTGLPLYRELVIESARGEGAEAEPAAVAGEAADGIETD